MRSEGWGDGSRVLGCLGRRVVGNCGEIGFFCRVIEGSLSFWGVFFLSAMAGCEWLAGGEREKQKRREIDPLQLSPWKEGSFEAAIPIHTHTRSLR